MGTRVQLSRWQRTQVIERGRDTLIGQNKGWKVQQLVFVGGTCGSVHFESFNSNMKALGVLESKWDLIRRKLVRCLLEEQDKVLRSYFAQRGGDEEEW
jgi:hypothetical protein